MHVCAFERACLRVSVRDWCIPARTNIILICYAFEYALTRCGCWERGERGGERGGILYRVKKNIAGVQRIQHIRQL